MTAIEELGAARLKFFKDYGDFVVEDMGDIIRKCAAVCQEYSYDLGGLKSGIAEECAYLIISALEPEGKP